MEENLKNYVEIVLVGVLGRQNIKSQLTIVGTVLLHNY